MDGTTRGLATVSDARKLSRAAAICAVASSSLWLSSGCASVTASKIGSVSQSKPTEKMTVLVTLSPIADVVKNVAGDDARVLAIVPSEVDPHSFSPTPDDVRKMSGARAIFRAGHGIDDWIGAMAQSGDENTPVLDVIHSSHHSESASGDAAGFQHARAAKESTDHAHSESADAHFWMDPLQVVALTKKVCAHLCDLQPQSAKAFRARADAYEKQLLQLDAWTRSRVATLPAARRKLVTSHDELASFAKRYNFQVVGVAMPNGAGQNSANARDIAALVDAVRAARVPAIFADAASNPNMMKRLGEETGVRVVDVRVDTLGKPGTPSGTYLGFFRENVDAIVNALRS